MSSIEQLIAELRTLFDHESKIRAACSTQSPQVPSFQELADLQQQEFELIRRAIERKLLEFLKLQPQHTRHLGKLGAFHAKANYDESVFIMTKFPQGDTEEDGALMSVINAVTRAVRTSGYTPRIASDYDYHSLLWDNVELHLVGCCKGIAIVEDRYKPELNPNVAMEWGWMRAMGKDVLYLVEDGFGHQRADWSGLSEARFVWSDPEKQVPHAVNKWLNGGSFKP